MSEPNRTVRLRNVPIWWRCYHCGCTLPPQPHLYVYEEQEGQEPRLLHQVCQDEVLCQERRETRLATRSFATRS